MISNKITAFAASASAGAASVGYGEECRKMGIFDLFKQIEGEKHRMGKPEWLVVGLGNPGLEYAETRHNAGFLAISELAKRKNIAMTTMKFRSDCGDGILGETRCFFMKPATYMNNSGEAVAAAADFYKIPPERVLVLYDDISLPPGKIRIRRKGSAGGHNGMKCIIALLGSETFPRIKIGVGEKPHKDYNLADWVLGKFPEAEREQMQQAFEQAAEAAELIVAGKIEEAMSKYSH